MSSSARIADPWPAPRATGPVTAVVSLPGSKSQTNRALVLAALADGPSVVRRPLSSRDTTLMRAGLRSLGCEIAEGDDHWTIRPGPLSGPAQVDCGLAGTVMRFLPPVAGLAEGEIGFDGDPHMRRRPVGPVLDALRSVGVEIDGTSLPFTVRGHGAVRGGTVVMDASASSQFVSALLLAGARFDEGVEVRHDGPPVPSLPHIDMTVAMLREHAVEVDDTTPDRWVVAPGPVKAVDRLIEPDLSNAAPFLALAAVTGGEVTVRDWPRSTTQPGDAMREILTQVGCSVEHTDEGLRVRNGGGLAGLDLDLHDVGELTPAVAALAALDDSPSRLRGIGHIRGHETDRLAALARELGALGAEVTEHADGLAFRPSTLRGGVFHTYADHRMAHAGVIVGAAVDGVLVEDIATTSKPFPEFPQVWAALL